MCRLFFDHLFFFMAQSYHPAWESIDKQSVPEWVTNAKFGIFIHQGIYSVTVKVSSKANGTLTIQPPDINPGNMPF
jgi:pectin methylesterase-like acyl-CoA thioesterase